MNSRFNEDLSNEEALGRFLDTIYPTLFDGFKIQRIVDVNLQHRGVDLVISKDGVDYYIDEKAQLDYLNFKLPTFAFEISYIKDNIEHLGWLFDKSKETNSYFLINGIYLNDPKDINKGFEKCSIISVNRCKLIHLLESKKLDLSNITRINNIIRSGIEEKSIEICELNPRTQGRFYFSKSNKSEEPINLVLYIDFLIESKVAKRIY